MERKESKNGLELIKFGAIRLKGNFGALFLGTIAMVTPLVLIFLVPYLIARFTDIGWIMSIGIALDAIIIGPMQMGYIKYFNDVIDGKQPRLTVIYSQFKFSSMTLRTIYIAMLLILLYILGTILWIVTAGFVIAFFSMTLFFLEKYKYHKLSDAMTDCAKHMIGNRLAMFSYKLIFYFVYALLFAIGALCIALIFVLAGESMLISYIVTLCSVIVFIFMYSMITVYYHSCNQIFFEDTLMYNERKRNKQTLHKTEEKNISNTNSNESKEVIVEKENNAKNNNEKKNIADNSKENVKNKKEIIDKKDEKKSKKIKETKQKIEKPQNKEKTNKKESGKKDI